MSADITMKEMFLVEQIKHSPVLTHTILHLLVILENRPRTGEGDTTYILI